MGVYLGALIQAFVTGLIMPIIGLAIPDLGNLATFKIPTPPTELDSQGNPLDPNYVWSAFWRRRVPNCTNNLHNRSLRNLHPSQSHETMGNRIAQAS